MTDTKAREETRALSALCLRKIQYEQDEKVLKARLEKQDKHIQKLENLLTLVLLEMELDVEVVSGKPERVVPAVPETMRLVKAKAA